MTRFNKVALRCDRCGETAWEDEAGEPWDAVQVRWRMAAVRPPVDWDLCPPCTEDVARALSGALKEPNNE